MEHTNPLSYVSITPSLLFTLTWKILTTLSEQIVITNNNNDNDKILFDHNVQIEITIFNSLENQIINWSGDYY